MKIRKTVTMHSHSTEVLEWRADLIRWPRKFRGGI